MRRVKFLRLLLPALLVPFVLLIVLTVRQPPSTRIARSPDERHSGPRVEDLQFDDLLGGSRRMSLSAREGWQDAQGAWQLKGVERLEIERQDAPPIVISAEKGDVTGAPGSRVFTLEGGVEIREQEEGVVVSLPTLEVDQAAGVARSMGETKIEARNFRGRAASVAYSLKGEPTELLSLDVTTSSGLSVKAARAFLRQGTREAELFGGVRVASGASTLVADRARLLRGPDGRLEKVFANAGVVGTETPPNLPASSLHADAVELRWNEKGEPAEAILQGSAELRQASSSIAASVVHVRRSASSSGWEVSAQENVEFHGVLGEGPGELRCDVLNATLDSKGKLMGGQAEGSVRFQSDRSTGEAARATFAPGPGGGTVILESAPERRARLTSGETRVVADHIVTRGDGSSLEAEGRVEATLLPRGSKEPASAGLFRVSEAVHFVAARLKSEESGTRLTFRGSVRGWQGDRNISADEVIMDQGHDSLVAREHVSTRMPRSPERATSEADFIQISAGRLDYDGGKRHGVYTENVRARQSEGWVECARLEVDLSKEGSAVQEIRGFDDVKLEYRAPGKDGMPRPITGEADRLVYTPDDHTARLYGDKQPATMRRSGEDGGTTTGRVLRYRLDLGSLEVESGERDRARVRPSTK